MFDFIGKRKYWFLISAVMLSLSVGAFVFNGFVRGQLMNFGVDFTGGTLILLRFPGAASEGEIRDVLLKYNLTQSLIQKIGERDFSIRTEPLDTAVRTKVIDDLKAKYGEVELLEADTIGPIIGNELRTQSLWALFFASLFIIMYVSFRFEFKYAVASLLALYHDAIITTGVVAFLWRNIEVPYIAAILTIMGYSINDTIVIFDRVRENLKKYSGKKKSYIEIINISLNETMARSINTVLTTLFGVLAILFFGGETIKDFALVLLVGFVVGAYSSIFVASPIVAVWELAAGAKPKKK